MRLVSRFQNYSIQVKQAEQALVNGLLMDMTKPVNADFEHGQLMKWEQEAALRHWEDSFRGLPEGVKPVTRLSVFDTEWPHLKWDPEFRAQVEQFLANHPDCGQVDPETGENIRVGDFIVVKEPRLKAPWPKFDEQDTETIATILEATGTDPDYVRRYEYENQRRPEVFELVESLGAEPVDLEAITVKA